MNDDAELSSLIAVFENAKSNTSLDVSGKRRALILTALRAMQNSGYGRQLTQATLEHSRLSTRISDALVVAVAYGQIDGAHHKTWVIDQVVRILTGCPKEKVDAKDGRGTPYSYERLGESEEYRKLIADTCAGDDGPATYTWDVGTPP